MLAGVTDVSAIGVSPLGLRGSGLRVRGVDQQQKREDERIGAAKGHEGQALRERMQLVYPAVFSVLSRCLVEINE